MLLIKTIEQGVLEPQCHQESVCVCVPDIDYRAMCTRSTMSPRKCVLYVADIDYRARCTRTAMSPRKCVFMCS